MRKTIFAVLTVAAALAACSGSGPGEVSGAKAARKVLYYRSPMNPRQTSPVPAQDSMGMDFVPVYADAATSAPEPGSFMVSPDRLQLIGVKTAAAERRDLVRVVRTVARVAYDPDLYRTQEEYLAALSAAHATRASTLPETGTRSASLLAASRLRLRLQGLTDAQIDALGRAGHPDESLLISAGKGGTLWLYADVFESDLPYVRVGQAVAATSPSLPGEVFRGTVASIDPVLDPLTRSARARVRVVDPGGELRPDMYLDAEISADLGMRLAIPRDAVVDEGTRQTVFIDRGNGHLVARLVELGVATDDWVEVRRGIAEGDRVVTSGNFLIDSESQLQEAEASFGDGGADAAKSAP